MMPDKQRIAARFAAATPHYDRHAEAQKIIHGELDKWLALYAPERVAQIIAERRSQAAAAGLSPEVAEAVWQAMIAAFIRLETEVNRHA